MSRRRSRELAMKLTYQFQIQRDHVDSQLEFLFSQEETGEKDREYITEIVKGIREREEIIDGLIEKNAIGWRLARISKVDLAILRVSIYEILYREDIPYNVSINEAVEMAKKYSSAEAPPFINGILSNIIKIK